MYIYICISIYVCLCIYIYSLVIPSYSLQSIVVIAVLFTSTTELGHHRAQKTSANTTVRLQANCRSWTKVVDHLLVRNEADSHMYVWYGMVWYGMVWYGMVWYGMYVCNYCIFYCMHNTHISIHTHDVCVCLYVRTNDAKCCCFACCTKPGKPLRNFRELSDNLQCRSRGNPYANPWSNGAGIFTPTKLGDFCGKCWDSYSSTMEHIWDMINTILNMLKLVKAS